MNVNLKGLLWNSIQQFGTLGLSFISIVVLARLLKPEDYALYAMICIFISIAEQLADCGIGGYLVKTQNVTQDDYDTLFVFNLSVSLLLSLLLFTTAPLIASFYQRPIIIKLLRVLCLSIIFQSLSITQANRMLKELRFKTLASISIFVGFIALSVAIFMAYKGFGVWSLILQNVISTGLTSFIYYYINPPC